MNQPNEAPADKGASPAPEFTKPVPVPAETPAVKLPGAAKGDDDVTNAPVKPS